jgi:methylated-DNA-[protein]-cysteine S-methyltransferase
MTTYYCHIDSPLGQLTAAGDGRLLSGLYLPEHKGWLGPDASARHDDKPFGEVRKQLAECFAGERQAFDLPLKLLGTAFQLRVWQELARIPFGETITYAQLAERVGNSKASRAVGAANGRNPISIIVPCHRVIGASGTLTGYAGGVERKRWLLGHERAVVAKRTQLRTAQQKAPGVFTGG